MLAFLKSLYRLKWKTSVDAPTFLWAMACLSLFMMVTAGTIGGLVVYDAYRMLAFETLQAASEAPSTDRFIPFALVFGVCAALPLLWVMWLQLKLIVNRIHDFNFKAWYMILGYIVVMSLTGGISAGVASALGYMPPAMALLAATGQIFALLCLYILYFEPGRESPRFARSPHLVVTLGMGKKVLIGVFITLTVAISLLKLYNIINLI